MEHECLIGSLNCLAKFNREIMKTPNADAWILGYHQGRAEAYENAARMAADYNNLPARMEILIGAENL